MFVEDVSEVSW